MATPQSVPEKGATLSPDTESQPLSLPWSTRLLSRFTSDVDIRWADSILVGCFFVTGIVDSFAFNTYRCFVGMQTGMWSPSDDWSTKLTDFEGIPSLLG